MEHLVGRETKHPELADHIAEIRVVRLVASDILGRVDGVEIDAEPRVAVGEAGIVDIRQDHQLEMRLQIGQRLGGVGEGRPVLDRTAITQRLLP